MIKRHVKKEIKVGNKLIGGNNPILIQTMANIKTSNIDQIIDLIEDCKNLGNDLMRLSVLDKQDIEALKVITSRCSTPIIADIHFSPFLALQAIEAGISGIRLNPGNISNPDALLKIIEALKYHNIPLRIGVNSGSLPNQYKKSTPKNMFLALKNYVDFFEKHDFSNLVLSLKSSDPEITYKAYKLADKHFNYPLHIGVTESGANYIGAIRSSIGLVPLLNQGIGDTIRISLTEPPQDEVVACKALLKGLNLKKDVPILVSCPTCGRTQVDLFKVYNKVNEHLKYVNKDIKVAIMGCIVNGPGEAKDADIGIAGGQNFFTIFKKGKRLDLHLSEDQAIEYLIKEIDKI